MLRTSLVRSRLVAYRPATSPVAAQWQRNGMRCFADDRRPDRVVLPGSDSKAAPASVPPPPVAPQNPAKPTAAAIPPTPPTPQAVNAAVPTGTGTASTGPSIPPPPPPTPKKKSRLGRFITSLLVLSILGYGGGVYYSLVSDNFHDFFTEYVPFAEDAVAYFEEREFRKRFPSRAPDNKSYQQIRGENKITIGKASGLKAKPADQDKDGKGQTSLSGPGRHTSALDENKKPNDSSKTNDPSSSKKGSATDKADGGEAPKKSTQAPQANDTTPTKGQSSNSSQAEPKSTSQSPLVDHVTVPNAAEPVVQATVKMLNDLITVINADPNASKFQTTIDSAKSQLADIVNNISTLKAQVQAEAEKKISDSNIQFDNAAKELVSRVEREIQDQELKWREEYESERERISRTYESKLSAELDAAQKLAEQRQKTALVEQQITLNREFGRRVQERVEAERQGRLGKLGELSASVEELEKLTAEWNSVIDSNLQTQHLHVALGAVRAAIARFDHPTPFVAELAALKEIADANDVVNAAIASIPPVAYQRGLPTPAHLIDRFRRVAGEVRKAALLPEDAGVASHAASAVLSRLMFSKKGEGLPQGEDVEAVLTRTEVLLEEGDLDGAAREMNSLHGWAGVLSKDWVSECRRVLETKQALEVIATEARLQSLLVD